MRVGRLLQLGTQRVVIAKVGAKTRQQFFVIHLIQAVELQKRAIDTRSTKALFRRSQMSLTRSDGDEIRHGSARRQPRAKTARLFFADLRQPIIVGRSKAGLAVTDKQQAAHDHSTERAMMWRQRPPI